MICVIGCHKISRHLTPFTQTIPYIVIAMTIIQVLAHFPARLRLMPTMKQIMHGMKLPRNAIMLMKIAFAMIQLVTSNMDVAATAQIDYGLI